jgi:hypothetical protein
MGHDNTATHIQTQRLLSPHNCNFVSSTLDLTNAYLHAPILDVVYIYIPEGFPGQGEMARNKEHAGSTITRQQF